MGLHEGILVGTNEGTKLGEIVGVWLLVWMYVGSLKRCLKMSEVKQFNNCFVE